MSMKRAAGTGKAEELKALRSFLARQIDDCQSKRDAPGLVSAYLEVADRIEAAEPPVKREATGLDEFTAALRAKRGAASAS